MSYDLYLRDPVSKECLTVPGHMMYGGNIKCEVVDGRLLPTTTEEAYLNITYNYARYYYEAFPGKDKDPKRFQTDREQFCILDESGGIRLLNGLTGLQAVPALEEMIRRIESRYKIDDTWINTERPDVWYQPTLNAALRKKPQEIIGELFGLMKTMDQKSAEKEMGRRYIKHEDTVLVNEGPNDDYWTATAGNAIRPLYQLIALSKMRPDGVWSEES